MSRVSLEKLLSLSWFPYILILFEMLYMATPFAIFFYSVYRLPLQVLNASDNTAWLLQTILPHFAATDTLIIPLLLRSGWLLMATGLLTFIIGFLQIYLAKFIRKGAVTGGIYRFIRHPQYTSWIVFGFGMCLVWSRFIVWFMYVSMMFIYYLLARAEENECKSRFPETYTPYFNRTGMFLPRITISHTKHPAPVSTRLRRIGVVRGLVILCMALGATMVIGTSLRSFTLSRLFSCSNDLYVSLSLTPIAREQLCRTAGKIMHDSTVIAYIRQKESSADPKVLYFMPENWSIAELGMEELHDPYDEERDNPQHNPVSHGNPADSTPFIKKVLIADAKVIGKPHHDKILHRLKGIAPVCIIKIDLRQDIITDVIPITTRGIYDSIPVPVY